MDPVKTIPQGTAGDEATRAREMADLRARAEKAERDLKLSTLGRSHGVELTTENLTSFTTTEAGMEFILARKAEIEAAAKTPKAPISGSRIDVTSDQGDVFKARAIDNFMCQTGVSVRTQSGDLVPFARGEKDLGLRRSGCLDLIRRCASIQGEVGVEDWNKMEVAAWAIRHSQIGINVRSAANQTSSLFTSILANVMDKSLILGFQNFNEVTCDKWTRVRQVSDFKQFSTVALTLGNLSKAAENTPFAELTAADTGYNASLAMWGGTLTMTLQAIIDDDLGEFFNRLGQAGGIAKRTEDKEVYRVLMDATWTNDTTTTSALGTQDKLDGVRKAFRQKKGPHGEYLGNQPKYLLHPTGLSRAADQATGRANPPGEASYLASDRARSIEPIEVVYLDDTTVSSHASTTNWFLTGDSTTDTVIRGHLTGMEAPVVMEFDAGAVAQRKFKIMYPFVAKEATYVDNSGNTRLVGIQLATA